MEGSIRGPEGYPPPTLVRKRTSKGLRFVLLLAFALLAAAAFMAASRFLQSEPEPAAPPVAEKPVAPAPPTDVEAPAGAVPEAPAAPEVVVETPEAAVAAAPPSIDARQPNQWYYVGRLADGPAAIYSRTGGQWNYAFACNRAAKTIEIIATGIGDPGDFDRQAIQVGATKLAMDASYARDAGGTISTVLPAGDPFFGALDGATPMEIQLVANRKAIVPVGPALVRLIRTCRA
ncbi:hypothetical protein [Rhizorhabdus dicambivorans]|uniref:Uncharacterized protein n=1 Tax=Rhizorhabdus dicambivorans TaxID=1850238 RepID=A0A2A4FV74_9SPHN|nr:hypothetical protein [Rhizorhabdus dicambivorans]ATE64767.1 hypothetical protein CMV14_10435 [Rhizorhabdus dicambivorans]PCE41291.1 hypothetical protein COO09_15645 [Rhizorhabdus dicambivorans]